MIGRIFGESGKSTQMSSALSAVEWMVSNGAKVINLSLSGGLYSTTANNVMKAAYAKGTIIIAAAGNDGDTSYRYPASLDNVISVAAVDSNRNRASFSNYNNAVDIAAPGVDILSTYPLNLGGVLLLNSASASVLGDYFTYSTLTAVSGTLIDCPNYGLSKCPGPGRHICLIER